MGRHSTDGHVAYAMGAAGMASTEGKKQAHSSFAAKPASVTPPKMPRNPQAMTMATPAKSNLPHAIKQTAPMVPPKVYPKAGKPGF